MLDSATFDKEEIKSLRSFMSMDQRFLEVLEVLSKLLFLLSDGDMMGHGCK